MNHITRLFLFLCTFIISTFTSGQKSNAYKFIEPNISVSYDSSLFKISNRYTNTFYEKESYHFTYEPGKANNIFIYIGADHPTPTLSQRIADSVMLIDLKGMKNEMPKSLSIVSIDTAVRHLLGFSFIGIVAYDKKKKEYGTSVRGLHVTENDKTEIRYFSKNRNDLKKEYQVLQLFLENFTSYSKQEIEKEDSLVKSHHTVQIQPAKELPEAFTFRRKTFSGIVTVKQALKHTIAEARINMAMGQEVFSPNDKGEVPFVCYDEQKGIVEKKGELILLNSFGKRVRIPFSFCYENNGVQ